MKCAGLPSHKRLHLTTADSFTQMCVETHEATMLRHSHILYAYRCTTRRADCTSMTHTGAATAHMGASIVGRAHTRSCWEGKSMNAYACAHIFSRTFVYSRLNGLPN
jgi:hypothetical protein